MSRKQPTPMPEGITRPDPPPGPLRPHDSNWSVTMDVELKRLQEIKLKYYVLLFHEIGMKLSVYQSDLDAATKQFKQIMFSQIVGVDEFLTIVELMPGIFQPFCKGKNITIGELRNSVYNRELTVNEFLSAIDLWYKSCG